MDPITHTLAGAAMGEAGLKRRTGLGMAALMIGANLPDIDVLSIPFGTMLEFRRGWTHGVLAMIVLPFLLTGLLLAWDRVVRHRGGRTPENPAIARQLLLLSALSILSHPALDFLNTYGVRLLMPFDSRWFHGDALFIVDPWVLLVLAAGIAAARWRGRRRTREASGALPPFFPQPARAALVWCALYVVGMLTVSTVARAHIRQALSLQGIEHSDVMAAPIPVNPILREVVVRTPDRYLIGGFSLIPRSFELIAAEIPLNADHPAALAAAETPAGQAFLRWSRFPYYVIDNGTPTRVHITDLRYADDPGDSWAARTIVVE
jgi:inner membrane protein